MRVKHFFDLKTQKKDILDFIEKEANLLKIMKRFGFEEVVRCRISLDSRYNCKAGESCIETEDGFCRCYEDLWLRREID